MKTVTLEGRQTCNNGKTYRMTGTGITCNRVLHTAGNGYWSNEERAVRITALSVPYIDEDKSFGELRVFFDLRTWNTEKHGLIYTDRLFERELQDYLTSLGLAGKDVFYSEQGMQGDNYVSLDVGKKFIKSWVKMLNG